MNVAEQLGYRQTVLAIAREFREFIMNLDNCHDYFKLSFTKMRAPSFFVDREHEKGQPKYGSMDPPRLKFNGFDWSFFHRTYPLLSFQEKRLQLLCFGSNEAISKGLLQHRFEDKNPTPRGDFRHHQCELSVSVNWNME